MDLVRHAGFGERGIEFVNRSGGAPIILVGEVTLQWDADVGWIGELLQRDAVERHCRGDFGDMNSSGNRQRAGPCKSPSPRPFC